MCEKVGESVREKKSGVDSGGVKKESQRESTRDIDTHTRTHAYTNAHAHSHNLFPPPSLSLSLTQTCNYPHKRNAGSIPLFLGHGLVMSL